MKKEITWPSNNSWQKQQLSERRRKTRRRTRAKTDRIYSTDMRRKEGRVRSLAPQVRIEVLDASDLSTL